MRADMKAIVRTDLVACCLVLLLFLLPTATVWAADPPPEDARARLQVHTAEGRTSLSLPGGEPFHVTTQKVSDQQLITLEETGTRLALWNESDSAGNVTPFYAIGRDGAAMGDGKATSYTLKLRYANFDPLREVPAVSEVFASDEGMNLFIVHFVTQPLSEYRAAIRALGGTVYGFLANHAHIVKMNPATRKQVEELPFVRWVGPFHPAYRLEEFVLNELRGEQPPAPRRYNIMVFESGHGGKPVVASKIRQLGGRVDSANSGKFLLDATLSAAQLAEVIRWDEVLYVDRWSPLEPDMDIVRDISGANYLETVAGYTGAGVRAEIFDNGFNVDHPDFVSRPMLEHGGPVGLASHGTATAGINFGDGTGDPRARGLLPDGQGILADYNNIGLSGQSRYDHTGELKQDPYWAVFQTSSVGSARTRDYTTISADHDTLLFDWDVLHCQSQSNAGNQDSRPQAWAKNVVSGGAFNHYDTQTRDDDCWCGTASIGPAADGRIKPDLSFFYDDTYTTYSTGDGYGEFGGTSGATPSICGYFGLFFEMWSDGVFGNEVDPAGTVFDNRPHMTTAKAFMINTASQAQFSGTEHDMTRVHQGWGMPDIRNLWDMRDNISFIDETVLLANLETVSFNAIVDAGEPAMRVTMTYADPAGNPASSQHRINDLTLKVISPSGTVYWGNNGLLAEMWSAPGGSADTIDTVENVFVQNPEEGQWTIEITASEINEDGHVETPELDADFALVVSGAFMPACTSDGTISMNRSSYACEDSARVRVVDCDLNTDDNVIETVTVTVTSDTEPEGETLTLTETSAASATFQENLPLSETDAPGTLQVTDRDTIVAEYIDADDGNGGTNITKTEQASIDCAPPLISAVGETDVTDVSATIVWTTDEAASSEVIWGETTPPTTSKAKQGRRTSHSIPLSGLAECTIYYYEVRSEDANGNLAVDDNGGQYYYFETLGDFGNGLQPCHAGQVTIDQAVLSCSDTMTFEVVDLDLNLDAQAVDTATLFVSSTTEAEVEARVVTETGPNTSVFSGSIPLAQGSPTPNGILESSDGDTLTVTYHDADDGVGNSAVSFDTAVADCGGPKISNLTVTNITDQRFTVTWNTDEPADTQLEWGKTPALGTTASKSPLVTQHSVTLNQFNSCEVGYIRVSGTDTYGNSTTADLGGEPYSTSSGLIPGLYWQDTFENGGARWTLEGEWEVGAPQGLGGSSGRPDPTNAWNNGGVLGHDLSGQGAFGGDYEPDSFEKATSEVMDATTWTDSRLIFRRRLNVHSSDRASLFVWSSGTGRSIFSSEGSISEAGYGVQSFELGPLIDGSPNVRIEFRQQADSTVQYSGWNVDDVIIKDGTLPDYGACFDCSGAPSFAGVVSAVDDNACGQSSVTVSWNDVFSWGSSDSGTFVVYRDTTSDFTPSAANLIASGVAGLSYVDNTAPAGQQVYYLVRAESAETCGSGPNNGGVMDSGAVYAAATETSEQPVPGAIDDLLVTLVNDVHVRLTWSAPSGASKYNVYRSESPQPENFQFLGETEATFFDDETVGANANRYFYKVNAVNACGVEGE